jgi:hypothetical protein
MRLQRYTTLLLLLALAGSTPVAAQEQTRTYSQTRKLLLKVERSPANKTLKQLFEQADKRRADLIKALYESDQKISLNSQLILKYLAGQQDLAAIEEWYAYRRKEGQEYWIAPIDLLSERRYLEGSGRDLAKLVIKSLHAKSKGLSARVVAYSKARKTALIEVIFGAVPGNVFTEGWHIVIRQEEGKWRLISKNLVWQS